MANALSFFCYRNPRWHALLTQHNDPEKLASKTTTKNRTKAVAKALFCHPSMPSITVFCKQTTYKRREGRRQVTI